MLKHIFSLLVFGLFLLGSGDLLAQNSREIETRKAPSQLSEQQPKKKLTKKQARKQMEKTYAAYFDRLVVEYEDRMETNAKRYSQRARELRKPQYSDPSYFGHKKPPKKRPLGKRRKCKECLMWH